MDSPGGWLLLTYRRYPLKNHFKSPVFLDYCTAFSGAPNTAFRYGDCIRLQGQLETPPENEDFSYRDYLASQRIYSYIAFPTASVLQNGQGSLIMSALYSFQQRALDVVYRLFPDPEASLIRD
jgi:hypothetical protein